MQYFGEAFDPSRCKRTCDNCRNEAAVQALDLTELAKNVIRYGHPAPVIPLQPSLGHMLLASLPHIPSTDKEAQD
jgi:hypothetical protein